MRSFCRFKNKFIHRRVIDDFFYKLPLYKTVKFNSGNDYKKANYIRNEIFPQ